MAFELHYTGHGYPSMEEIENEAEKRGFTYSFWASENGYSGLYNGDTVVVYDTTEGMDEGKRKDAEKFGKSIAIRRMERAEKDARSEYFRLQELFSEDKSDADLESRAQFYSDNSKEKQIEIYQELQMVYQNCMSRDEDLAAEGILSAWKHNRALMAQSKKVMGYMEDIFKQKYPGESLSVLTHHDEVGLDCNNENTEDLSV